MQFRIWHKLALIGLAFTLPLATATYLLVIESGQRIDFTRNEMRGLEYLRPLGALLPDLAQDQTQSRLMLEGQGSATALRASQARVDADFATLMSVDARLGGYLRTTSADLNADALPATQQQSWRTWRADQPDEASNDAEHAMLASNASTLIGYVGVTSNLVLDPQLDTYDIADALVVRAPDLVSRIWRLGDRVDQLLATGQVSVQDRNAVSADVAILNMQADTLQNDLFTTFRHDDDPAASSAVEQALAPLLHTAYLATANLTSLTRQGLTESPAVQLDRARYAQAVATAGNAMSTLWTAMLGQENQMLSARLAGDMRDRLLGLSAVLAAFAITVLLTFWLGRRITVGVRTVARVATALAGGDLAERATVRSRDEIGAMSTAFNGMAARLQEMIEEQLRAERAVRTERDFVDAVVEVAGSLVLVVDMAGRIVRFNHTCEVTTGYTFAEVVHRPFWDLFLVPPERDRASARFGRLSASDFPVAYEGVLTHRNGEQRCVSWSNAALVDDGGRVTHVIMTGIDVTTGRAAEVELREAQQRFRQAFDNASIGMCLVDMDARFMQVNRALCRLFGRDEDELSGLSLADVTHPDDLQASLAAVTDMIGGDTKPYRAEKRYVHADGHIVWTSITACVVCGDGGEPLYFVTQIEDITERREAEAQLVHQASHDPLTGLPNRTLLMDRLRQVLLRAGRHPSLTAVMFIDLDGFKDVNDSLGHDIGDHVLREVGLRLRRQVGPADTVARLGGDEFVVLCQDLASEDGVVEVVDRLAGALAEPVMVRGFEVVVTASVGIALADGSESTPEDLLRDADTAMYGAKNRGKNRYQMFDETLRARVVDRIAVAATLRQGLRDDRFVLHFQPVIDIASGALVSVESLVRLDDPERGLLAPGTFIQVAEDSGLIVPIGAKVLGQACRQLAAWRAEGLVPAGLQTAVNISARQATRPDLSDTVARALAETGLEPGALALELTETVLMEADSATLRQLEQIRDTGVGLGIDDFGTGYSSLSYLKRLPVNFVKVDRSFVAGLATDPSDREIVTAVIRLGKALGLTTIAEGVECVSQFELLRDLGCDQAQGYLLGRPQAGPPGNPAANLLAAGGTADRGAL